MKTIIEKLKKFFSSIKGFWFIAAIVIFILFWINNGCQRRKAIHLAESLTELNVKNDLLAKDNKALDKRLKEEAAWRVTYENKAKLLEADKQRVTVENTKLKNKLKDIPDWLNKIPADSSYQYLIQIAYPYSGEMKYPFNSPQVKDIHKNYAENVIYTALVDTLDAQLLNCEVLTSLKDSINKSLHRSLLGVTAQKDNMNVLLGNYVEKEKLYVKENNKLHRHVLFYKITTGAAVVIALLVAL